MKVRSGELKKTWFRCERFIHTEDGWYFVTRENTQQGPFDNQKDAEQELSTYIRDLNKDLFSSLRAR
ncbi:DUF6316 family protein [Pleionea sediminis]|uniref:DUF6316 family protein n=1 Tax=Pleionea sediminis TaxID=2569479 RepID=UPI001184EB06|nr:DUF6316 family protein [Pleionea sediminis]